MRQNVTCLEDDLPQNIHCGTALPMENYHSCCIECCNFTNEIKFSSILIRRSPSHIFRLQEGSQESYYLIFEGFSKHEFLLKSLLSTFVPFYFL